MCGIIGIYSFNDKGKESFKYINDAVDALKQRGPDGSGVYKNDNVVLGHSRLAIIDTSEAAAQPFTDNTGRYTIVFNGEIYNFQQLKNQLQKEGESFKSTSDTEVLLKLYIKYKERCLSYLNGFFAFAVYDKAEDTVFVARDRIGIKPLLYYQDNEKIIFGSEMKAILAFQIPRLLNFDALQLYFQLNYIPGHASGIQNVKKIEPGSYLVIKNKRVEHKNYYRIPYNESDISEISYQDVKSKLHELLDESVKLRMISDVPLGAFLSGGIDSSVIVSLASKYTGNLNTFSIGYKDEPFFDETKYAELVANKFQTNHTAFQLTNDDLLANLHDVLNYIDEPFGDSSALPVHILSMHTRKHVTVALSGDGADEMFSGYNKHMAHYLAMNPGSREKLISSLYPVLKLLPKSRNGKVSNYVRQALKYAEGTQLDFKDRYWKWCSISDKNYVSELLKGSKTNNGKQIEEYYLNLLQHSDKVNDILYADMHLVLVNDMLTKVDLMSMANSLEVRTPFLDHNLVNFVFRLPDNYKINRGIKKRILQDTFKDILPKELYQRPKHGFEVPLHNWFQNELNPMLNENIFNEDFIEYQGVFNWSAINDLRIRLFSQSPGDVSAQLWGILVFQHWWKKYFG